MKNIMHVLFSLCSGGLENMVVDIANIQARKNNVQVVVINDLVDKSVFDRISLDVDVVLLKRTPKSKSFIPLIKFYFNNIRFKPDIVHIHCREALKLYPSIFNWTPIIIYTEHDVGKELGDEIRNADKVIAISDCVRKDLKFRLNVDAITIYNGVPCSQIKTRQHYPSILSEVHIVQISRLDPCKKGQDILIKALVEVQKLYPDFNFSIDFIGGGQGEALLINLVEEYNLKNCVNFLGVLSKNEIYRHLKDYHMLIQPSRYEGFGLTIVEAMAAGVPVVASNIDGPKEIISNTAFGKLFESCNKEDLVIKIAETIEEYKNGKIMDQVTAARRSVLKTFDVELTAEKYTQF